MKLRRSAATAALAATGAYAQNAYGQSASTSASTTARAMSTTAAPSVSYTTVTYSDCPSDSMDSLITVTKGVTATYCPECVMASASAQQPGHTTVYTTTYMSLCPTGMVPATYTVTESCTEPTPTWTPGPSHIPQGFTVTTEECTVCQSTPTTVTITEPCGCEAHEGVPVTNTAVATTPGGGSGSGGNTPAATTPAGGSGSSSPGGSSPGSGSPAPGTNSSCSGPEECGGSANQSPPPAGSPAPAAGGSGAAAPPYPTSAATVTESCPGPQCRAAATGYPSGVTYGNTSGIVPSTGDGVSGLANVGVFTSLFLAVAVAALAFTL